MPPASVPPSPAPETQDLAWEEDGSQVMESGLGVNVALRSDPSNLQGTSEVCRLVFCG